MSTRKVNSKITIAGAGLVGSLLALMWRQKGFAVEVFEKRADIRKNNKDLGRSINLVITSRGVHALKQVGLWEKVQPITVAVFGRMIHGLDRTVNYQPYGRNQECNYSVSRAELNKFLIDEAEKLGAQFHFEQTVESVDFEQKKIHFEKNNKHETFQYDLLFATDGAGSEVRKSLMQVQPDIDEKIIPFPTDYKELFMPATSQGEYALDHKALHIWPRGAEMLMALPNPGGSFTMTIYLSKAVFQKMNDKAEFEKYFKTQFSDCLAIMPDYSHDFASNKQGSLNTLKLSRWTYKNSVCLLGDAAHAIVPFFGQGMNLGFEDCTELLKIFDSTSSWEECFTKFFNSRKPNADAIADMAIENGNEMSEKVGDKKFLLKKQIEHKIEEELPNHYRSRYGLITYTLTPYSLALKAGLIQETMLNEIMQITKSPDDLNWSEIKKLIEKKFTPFVNENKVSLA